MCKKWLLQININTWNQISICFREEYLKIYHHHHHHHHIVLVARISLTLSRHSSLSFIALGRSSGQQPVSSHSCWMYVRAGRPAFARPCVGIHKSTSLMSSSLKDPFGLIFYLIADVTTLPAMNLSRVWFLYVSPFSLYLTPPHPLLLQYVSLCEGEEGESRSVPSRSEDARKRTGSFGRQL